MILAELVLVESKSARDNQLERVSHDRALNILNKDSTSFCGEAWVQHQQMGVRRNGTLVQITYLVRSLFNRGDRILMPHLQLGGWHR